MQKHKLTFIGLGVMGAPMAGHLAGAGHAVTVFNRSVKKSADWSNCYSGSVAESLSAAVAEAEMVMMCLGDDQSVESNLTDASGVLSSIKPGTIIIDHTTTSAKLAKKMALAAQSVNAQFLDAPVSGGEAGAQNGRLTVMVGGDSDAFDRSEAVIKHYAQAVTLMGDSGSGQLTKMVNQLCVAGLVQALAEGLAFSQKAGLDTGRVLEVISKGAAQSWQMENRGHTMIDGEFDFGFAVDHMRKDLGLCIAQAREINADIPIAEIVDDYYAQVQAMGGARWDTSSLIKRLT